MTDRIAWSISTLQWGRGFSAAERPCAVRSVHLPPQASMGPRLLSRGGSPYGDGSKSNMVLQWGRGFSAAERWAAHPAAGATACFNGPRLLSRGEAILHSVAVMKPDTLQWGRGFSAAERTPRCRTCSRRRCFNGAAASQPRREVSVHKTLGRYGASMGPRLLSRGEGGNGWASLVLPPLQWGRGFSAAERRAKPAEAWN